VTVRGDFVPQSDQYRRYGAECVKLAATVADPDDKALMLAIAEGWRALAERAASIEKANRPADEIDDMFRRPKLS
jgi:hypothetical protein